MQLYGPFYAARIRRWWWPLDSLRSQNSGLQENMSNLMSRGALMTKTPHRIKRSRSTKEMDATDHAPQVGLGHGTWHGQLLPEISMMTLESSR